jgi:hypothetical protein
MVVSSSSALSVVAVIRDALTAWVATKPIIAITIERRTSSKRFMAGYQRQESGP